MGLKGISGFLRQFAQSSSSNAYNKSSQAQNRGNRTAEVFDFLSLVNFWPEIVGPKLALHTLPIKSSKGVLTVLTDHPAYGQELSFLQNPLIKKIEAKFPSLKNQIKRLLFQNDPTFFNTKKAMMAKIEDKQRSKETPKYHPHSPEVKAARLEAQEVFAHISDDEVREAMISLHIQVKLG